LHLLLNAGLVRFAHLVKPVEDGEGAAGPELPALRTTRW
jgi:hypothetical protein